MKQLVSAIKLFFFLTVLTGVVYPLLITIIARVFFPQEASGTLVSSNGRIAGSALIGQKFTESVYFHARPSATDYSTMPSGGSNLGPTSLKLKNLAEEQKLLFIEINSLPANSVVPAEMIFASASGLDPHISKCAALMQVKRVASARGYKGKKEKDLEELVLHLSEKPQFSLFGEERVNVLMLNLELDKLKR